MLQIVTLHLARSSRIPRAATTEVTKSSRRSIRPVIWILANGERLGRNATSGVSRRDEGERRGLLLHRAGGANGQHGESSMMGKSRKRREFTWRPIASQRENISHLPRGEDGHLKTFKIARIRPVVASDEVGERRLARSNLSS